MADERTRERVRAARALDLRRIIGGVLGLYGVVLVIAGLVGSEAQKTKAAGENVNLWTGIALIVVASLFVLWSVKRPVTSRDLKDPGAGGGTDG
jgi:hypothetical protein